eukprot:g19570.t1
MYPRWLLAGCVVLLVQADGKPGLRAGTSSRSKQPDVLDLPRNDSGIPSLQGCLQRLSSEYYSTYPVALLVELYRSRLRVEGHGPFCPRGGCELARESSLCR